MKLDWPLMQNNITQQDCNVVAGFLLSGEVAGASVPQLTNGAQVRAFEEEFAAWLGCKYAVMVNSGSSANIITMQAVAQRDKIIHDVVAVPCIAWISDITALIQANLLIRFCDIDPYTLGIDTDAGDPKFLRHSVIFATHCLGFDANPRWTPPLLFRPGDPVGRPAPDKDRPIIIEDCCESIGATRGGKKLGTFGLASNFSFYYAHHMSTIEGGMICTDDWDFYQTCRRLRSHGLVREMIPSATQLKFRSDNPSLDPNFIFAEAGYNMRSTEINAVIGREQLKRLDANIARRTENLLLFLKLLDGARYRTNYPIEGSSNYALPLILNEPDESLMAKVLLLLRELNVEYRKGTAGGGSQLRQPYAKKLWGKDFHKQFPQAEHVSDYGLYIGNFPDLESWKIESLCERLNSL